MTLFTHCRNNSRVTPRHVKLQVNIVKMFHKERNRRANTKGWLKGQATQSIFYIQLKTGRNLKRGPLDFRKGSVKGKTVLFIEHT